MSNSQTVKTSSSQREADEYTRLQMLLAERNISLQAAEHRNKKYETAIKCARIILCVFAVLYVAYILINSLGADL